jgi:NADH:ubiquinone oxidoreductase, Na(+)-translocating, C subunit
MKLNTNSNAYTITYATVVVVIVAFLLAFAYAGLKERSDSNERIDKKQQILAALNIRNVDKVQTEDRYKEVVMADEIVNARGQVLKQGGQKDQDGFKVDRKSMSSECLPVYVCRVGNETKYVIPMVGKGLWGSIWGFVALNADGQTIYGAYFSHESETAGLGSLIKEEPFQKEFQGKKAYLNGIPTLKVVKSGTVKDANTECDGITGATLTSKGVNDMIHEYLKNYQAYLASLK